MKQLALIQGSGGGGKGGGSGSSRSATEAPDTLRSIEYARVLDLISEGEIVGLVNGLKSVYLNSVPVENNDGTFNFVGVTLASNNGTQSQSYIPGFAEAESEVNIAAQIFNNAPLVRTITNPDVDTVRVTVSIPQLTDQNTTTGDLSGTSVTLKIEIQTDGGGYVEQTLGDGGVISGKTKSKYQRSYLINLHKPGSSWDIRVSRVTADNPPSNIANQTWWDSYTMIINSKIRYVNSAVIGLQVDATQFNSIPVRGFDIKGLKVKIPSNYNPITRAYTGIWDGTFTVAHTDNPAWCYYDLSTNTRYGLGKYISDGIDKWALYTIGKYCDELIDDGFGGTEPRFTCNLYLQTQEDAYKALAAMTSIFRGMSFWSAGSVTTVQDSPSNVVALYTPANIIDGQFHYQGSAGNTRHTVAYVTWNNPDLQYKQDVEYVEDAEGIKRYGIKPTNTVAVGCTSRGQAHRWGRWLLYTERMETEVVTLRVGMDGTLSPPGSVIYTADPTRAGVRFGGRIVSATTTVIQLDNPVTIISGKTYTLSCVLPDGTVETKPVSTGVGLTSTLTVSSAFSAAPQDDAVRILIQNDLQPEKWRVVSVSEVSTGIFEISALENNSSKYGYIENNLQLEIPVVTRLSLNPPPPPTNFQATETLYEVQPGVLGQKIHLSWSPPLRSVADSGGTFGVPVPNTAVVRYIVGYQRGTGNWVETETTDCGYDIKNASVDDYHFYLCAVNSLGKRSTKVTTTLTVTGDVYADPSAPTGFSGVGGMFANSLAWTIVTDGRKDLQRTEIWGSTTNNRAGASNLSDKSYPSNTFVHVGLQPGQAWYYWIRVFDNRQNYSPWTPSGATAGLACTPSSDPADLLKQLKKAVNLDQFVEEISQPITLLSGVLNNLGLSIIQSALDSKGNGGAIWTLQTVTANSADDMRVVQVRLDSGDYAAVKNDVSIIMDPITGLRAKAGVSLDVNGHVIGWALNDNSATGSFVVVADSFEFVRPGAPGTVEPFFIAGTVNDVSMVGINGALFSDGSIIAKSLNVTDLSSITADLGTITAGTITLDAAGFVRGGQTDYDVGAGFFLGYSGGDYKFSIGDADSYLRWDGVHLSVKGGFTGDDYAAGDIAMLSMPSESFSSSYTYVKAKEAVIVRDGTLRISFQLRTSNGAYNSFARIYRNGVAVGTEQNTYSTTTYLGVEFTEDISGWTAQDLLQIYIHQAAGTAGTATIWNVLIASDKSLVEAVTFEL